MSTDELLALTRGEVEEDAQVGGLYPGNSIDDSASSPDRIEDQKRR